MDVDAEAKKKKQSSRRGRRQGEGLGPVVCVKMKGSYQTLLYAGHHWQPNK
jgi:hypothetical protein